MNLRNWASGAWEIRTAPLFTINLHAPHWRHGAKPLRIDFLVELTRRRVVDRYIGTSSRIFWVVLSPVIPPLINVAVFYFIARIPRSAVNGLAAYAAFMFSGLLPFRIVAESNRRELRLAVANMEMLKTAVFPLPFLTLSAVGASLVEFLVQCAFMAILLVVAGSATTWTIVLLPFALIALFALTLGLSWLLSVMSYALRDLQEIMSVLFSALLYVTPIMSFAGSSTAFFAGADLSQSYVELRYNVPRHHLAGRRWNSLRSLDRRLYDIGVLSLCRLVNRPRCAALCWRYGLTTMKILITGAGGFVGKRLAAVLAEVGHEIVALVHSLPPNEDRKYFVSKRINTLEADLTTFALTGLPSGIQGIIALAQSVHFREFPERATEVFDVNVITNLRLLDWAVRSGVRRFVLASSGGIYGWGKLGVQFQETHAFPVSSPLGFYLGSKLCSEIVFQNYAQFFDTAVILRPFFIYGPGQREDMFVARLIKGVREGRPISLQGSHGLKVNPIFVDDAVKAFAAALLLSGAHVVNVAGPEVIPSRNWGFNRRGGWAHANIRNAGGRASLFCW